VCGAAAHPVEAETALTALKALPKNVAGKVLRIEAQNGRPEPETWRLTVRDSEAEFGLREYVVHGGQVVGDAESSPPPAHPLDPEAVIGPSVKLDSDKVTALALEYALANGVVVGSMNHELQKQAVKRPAEWKITCFSEDGAEAGSLVFSASKGAVLSRSGFPLDPPKPGRSSKAKFKPLSRQIVGTGATAEPEPLASTEVAPEADGDTAEAKADETASSSDSPSGKPTASSSSKKRSSVDSGSRRARRGSAGNGIRRATAPVRRIIRRVLPF
jgi:hypothetical protein